MVGGGGPEVFFRNRLPVICRRRRRPVSPFSVTACVKSRTRPSCHGLRDEQQYGRRSGPTSCRQGIVPAVDGTAFQRRSDATAQRQLTARLRKLGYGARANPARMRLRHARVRNYK